MAEAAPAPVPNIFGEKWEILKKIRRLRELYKGRFTEDQCGVLLRHNNNDLDKTLLFMFEEPRKIRHVIGEEDWIKVSDVAKELRENAKGNKIEAELRQFACKDCNHNWTKKVPSRKKVSKCNKCNRSYKAIPKDEEYGWARFHCDNCDRRFEFYGMMELKILHIGLVGKSQAYCLECYTICEPIEIIHRRKRRHRRDRGRARWRHEHGCTAFNCFNIQRPMPGIPVINICVHPKSLTKLGPGFKCAGLGSEVHTSTGSTVATFLTQDSPTYSSYNPSLAGIDESEYEGTD